MGYQARRTQLPKSSHQATRFRGSIVGNFNRRSIVSNKDHMVDTVPLERQSYMDMNNMAFGEQ